MIRTPDNLPRRNGIPLMKLRDWLAGKPLGQRKAPKPPTPEQVERAREWQRQSRKPLERKPMKAKRYAGKHPDQKAYEAVNGHCELCDRLDDLAPESWERFKRQNSKASQLWAALETHHLFGRRWGNAGWNLIRACGGCHKFSHAHPKLGRLAGALEKDRKGELSGCEARKPNPLALICQDLEEGFFAGRCEEAARELCRRHGL